MRRLMKWKVTWAILIAVVAFFAVAAAAPIMDSPTSEVEACGFYTSPTNGGNNHITIIDWFFSLFD